MDISLTRASALVNGGKPNSLPFTSYHSFLSPSNLHFSIPIPPTSRAKIRGFAMRVSSSVDPVSDETPLIWRIKNATKTIILTTTVAALTFGRFSGLPVRADAPATSTEEETKESQVHALKSLLQRKLKDGKDEEALKILRRLVEAQPLEVEWKILMARLLNQMGEKHKAQKVYEEIMKLDPQNFEAFFEDALLMGHCEGGEAILKLFEEAITDAGEELKSAEGRYARLIFAQMQLLRKNVDEALRIYQELAREDPNDFRPYFCQSLIYILLGRNKEARKYFVKYSKVAPKKFEVGGYLQTPLTKKKVF